MPRLAPLVVRVGRAGLPLFSQKPGGPDARGVGGFKTPSRLEETPGIIQLNCAPTKETY
jgi:hypothetical protein